MTLQSQARELIAADPSIRADISAEIERWRGSWPPAEAVPSNVMTGLLECSCRFDAILGEPIQKLTALRELLAGDPSRDWLGREVLILAAASDQPRAARAEAALLFDDYDRWPDRFEAEIRAFDKETGAPAVGSQTEALSRGSA